MCCEKHKVAKIMVVELKGILEMQTKLKNEYNYFTQMQFDFIHRVRLSLNLWKRAISDLLIILIIMTIRFNLCLTMWSNTKTYFMKNNYASGWIHVSKVFLDDHFHYYYNHDAIQFIYIPSGLVFHPLILT